MGSSFRLFKILRVLFSERIDELLPQPKRGTLKALAWCIPIGPNEALSRGASTRRIANAGACIR